MREHDDQVSAPPGPVTVAMIVIMSIIVLIASGYVIYTYSSVRPSPVAQTTPSAPR